MINSKEAQNSESTGASQIIFPHEHKQISTIAIDIGGSLAKIVWFTSEIKDVSVARFDREEAQPNILDSSTKKFGLVDDDVSKNDKRNEGNTNQAEWNEPKKFVAEDQQKYESIPLKSTLRQNLSSRGGRLNFRKFETADLDDLLNFASKIILDGLKANPETHFKVRATGGGAFRFKERLQAHLKVPVYAEDEMECLVTGLSFLVRHVAFEVFTYDERSNGAQYENRNLPLFPYILVNIGSGVSIIKVTSEETYERISGTSLGGGTLWGLLAMMTDANGFDEMLDLSKKGDNKNVDMLVGDIYGGDYTKMGLKGSTIASSFGKVFKVPKSERTNFSQADIASSLLYLVSNNIAQIAYLNAQSHGITRIYFSGFFIRGHPITMNTLSYAISYWSKGSIEALFLRHEGYLGAVGAFLREGDVDINHVSFKENFSLTEQLTNASLGAVGILETSTTKLAPFPLLHDAKNYSPDTLLLNDPEAQKYWIDLLDVNIAHLVQMVISMSTTPETSLAEIETRSKAFGDMYRNHLNILRKQPAAYGEMSVRSLLNLREQCLREMQFTDVFFGVKSNENEVALKQLPDLLQTLDVVIQAEGEERLFDLLIDNVLGGNMFDWGANSTQEMLKTGKLDLTSAKSKITRPLKLNNVHVMREKIIKNIPYRKMVIFVDNAGSDFVFGIIPFIRYILSKGTNVTIAANTFPAVNDITVSLM